MPVDEGAYCELTDLLTGDLDLPRYMGDGSSFVNMAAEDIDSHVGHIYVTPIIVSSSNPRHRASELILKRINRMLASGRIMLDIAAAGEQSDLHAYGRAMLKEAMDLLDKISSGDIVLAGAEPLPVPEGEQGDSSGPRIHNEDSVSLVQSFYEGLDPNNLYPLGRPQVRPYG